MQNNITNLEDALQKIKELEEKCSRLQRRIDELESRKAAGRKVHNSDWQATYNLFVPLYENGDSIPLIVEKTGISRRTLYRYKAYYDSLRDQSDS